MAALKNKNDNNLTNAEEERKKSRNEKLGKKVKEFVNDDKESRTTSVKSAEMFTRSSVAEDFCGIETKENNVGQASEPAAQSKEKQGEGAKGSKKSAPCKLLLWVRRLFKSKKNPKAAVSDNTDGQEGKCVDENSKDVTDDAVAESSVNADAVINEKYEAILGQISAVREQIGKVEAKLAEADSRLQEKSADREEIIQRLLFVAFNCSDSQERQKLLLNELKVLRYSDYSMKMVKEVYKEMSRCENYELLKFHMDRLGNIIKDFESHIK